MGMGIMNFSSLVTIIRDAMKTMTREEVVDRLNVMRTLAPQKMTEDMYNQLMSEINAKFPQS